MRDQNVAHAVGHDEHASHAAAHHNGAHGDDTHGGHGHTKSGRIIGPKGWHDFAQYHISEAGAIAMLIILARAEHLYAPMEIIAVLALGILQVLQLYEFYIHQGNWIEAILTVGLVVTYLLSALGHIPTDAMTWLLLGGFVAIAVFNLAFESGNEDHGHGGHGHDEHAGHDSHDGGQHGHH